MEIKNNLLQKTNNIKDIEKGILKYFLIDNKIDLKEFKSIEITSPNEIQEDIINYFTKINLNTDIEVLIDLFEILLTVNEAESNGVIFTPKYISDFIVKESLDTISKYNSDLKIIDPSSGCGIFLISAIEYINNRFDIPINEIITNNIYGIDIMDDNIRRTKYVLEFYLLIKNSNTKNVKLNLITSDSLKTDWKNLFNINKFDYIIGNPPYLNTRELNNKEIRFLKDNFTTTKQGSFNLFYAFIEKGMSQLSKKGKLSYIIPNNFFTINAAKELREFLQVNQYIEKIIDFEDNMIFKPTRTYNSICTFSFNNDIFDYANVPLTNDIQKSLNDLTYNKMNINDLDKNHWIIKDKKTLLNIKKIESNFFSIDEFIKTGIATLKDEVFLIEKKDDVFFKIYNSKEYIIEPNIVKELYKISDIKKNVDPENVKRYIIFPYELVNNKNTIIPENKLKNKYPLAYKYLLARKPDLATRDKGRPNSVAWYAYGRGQGINNIGRKLIYPTFSDVPKFTLIENKTCLICNGYGITEGHLIKLEILQKILNSIIMHYYVSNTSYTISGGYYCYQKKYIKDFTIPYLKESDINKIKSLNDSELDNFLIKLYELNINQDKKAKD